MPPMITTALTPTNEQLSVAYNQYVGKRVRLKGTDPHQPLPTNGKPFDGTVYGIDPQPKPNIDGQHFPAGTWLVIRLDPEPGKISNTVYRLPEQVQVL